jgi:hypothetical protein
MMIYLHCFSISLGEILLKKSKSGETYYKENTEILLHVYKDTDVK